MKVLVTGGAGYVGTELVAALAQMPAVDEILVYDNLQKASYTFFLGSAFPNPTKIKFIDGDILDSRKFRKALDGVHTIFHLAAKVTTPFANMDPHYFEQVNHWGTAEVVYAVEESDIEQFIFLSSSSVYGSSPLHATEETEPNPRTFYGISKMRAEDHVKRLQDKKRAIILRSGNVFGYSKSMRFDAVINRFMFDANFNNRISIHGNGKQHRGFIHVETLVHILSQMIAVEVPNGIYNLVEKNLSILDIVDVLKELYPNLEYMFINQHMKLRELQVSTESKLYEHIKPIETRSLSQELADFKAKFTF